MSARARFLAHEHGAYFKQPGLHGAKVLLDFLQRHVIVVNPFGREFFLGDMGDRHVTSGEFHGLLLGLFLGGFDNLAFYQFQFDKSCQLVLLHPPVQHRQASLWLGAG